ncbi:MAG: hypothetical protein HY901_09745 [Deltaproteobacteria bacterium]|nr:hypothetical protein [Deltaproteobacteria bacterium]
MRSALACAGAVLALVAEWPAHAYRFNESVEVYGYTQIWLTLWEQMEDDEGLVQYPSKDEAADALSGLSINKARVGLRLAYLDWHLSLHTQVKIDHDFNLLDLDVGWAPRRWFSLHLGQLKIPNTFEALTEDQRLDFILRSDITTALADWSLSKSQHPASLLYGSASNLRDLGLAAKGELKAWGWTGRYFLMVGNGLGANMYFGGLTRKEYWITNKSQFLYGGRLEVAAYDIATLGAFGSYNEHDNIVFNSGRAVYDLSRRSVGGDLRVTIPKTGARLYGLGGEGQIRDDFNSDGHIDLRYSAWAAAAIWDLVPLVAWLTDSQLPEGHALELAGRFEHLSFEMDDSGSQVHRDQVTFGASYVAAERLKVQLNYVLRSTEDPLHPERDTLANNVLFANFQASF